MSGFLIQAAEELAHTAHAGQTRRDGITPYIGHPSRVAWKLAGRSPEIIAAAWLHDTLEDTKLTVEEMSRCGIPGSVIEAVQVLTKQPGVSYDQYLAAVKANPIAWRVKVADMLDNLSDSPTDRQIVKYAHGLLFLFTP
jgi:(p)ppGpp synthase/HD superfamily hydrolase